MDQFALRDGVLHAEDIPLPRIAKEVGTPVYVYSRAMLERHAQEFRNGLKDVPRKHLAFAIKSNPNLGVLRVLAWGSPFLILFLLDLMIPFRYILPQLGK